jgi:hypothetical protein
VGHRVQLVPAACRVDQFGRELPQIDDQWVVIAVTDEGVEIQNHRTNHRTVLANDHIHHFTSNPGATLAAGLPHGFFTLLVQVFIQGPKLWIKPTLRPGEAVAPPPSRLREKRVDFAYPRESGLLKRLESEGFEVAWCRQSRLTRLTELEGWDVVAEAGDDGGYLTFRLRDSPEDQILTKRARKREV